MEDTEYEAFVKEMQEKHPVMFSRPFGGFCIGPGWYQIIRSLCDNIQAHINSVDCARTSLVLRNPWNRPIPKRVPQVIVTQIKEKFGGLRFYHDGGDDMVEGMVHMAESWAAHTCETCGNAGTNRSVGGWLTTLCDMHYNERLDSIKERNNENR